MGITGLIPFLEKSSKKGNISQFSGCTVAIDTYCWLHKGAFSCADKIAMGQPTDAYVHYCMKLVNMLLANRIKPILVFDGCHLPAKADTEVKRRESREANKKRAAELMKMGQTIEGRNLLRRSVDITHEMALEVIKKCHERNIDCIVAPYEADAQLAYLNISGIADVVITEDSDLTLFGCTKIFFKMDITGNGLLVEQDRLHLAMNLRPEHFDIDRFRHMCILSGCDYLASLPGIGLNKACKFVLKNSEPDIGKALTRLGPYLNMKSLVVTTEYREAFMRALATFKHQLVFCPIKRQQVRLYPPSTEITKEQLYHAGEEKPNDLAYELALGNYDPSSLKKLHNYDPDNYTAKTRKTNSWDRQQPTQHQSIWSRDFKIVNNKMEAPKIATTTWPNTVGKVQVMNTTSLKQRLSPLKRTHQDLDNDLTDNDMMRLYGSNKIQKNEKFQEEKECVEREKEITPPTTPTKSNPFLKTKCTPDTSPCLVRGRRRKLRTLIACQPTVIDTSVVVQSKYFVNDNGRKAIIIPETQDEDLPITQIDEYKENDEINKSPQNKDEGLILSRFDSGVDVKDDISNDKIDNYDNEEVYDGFCPENNESCSKGEQISREPNSDDVVDYTVNNSNLNSLRSSFFKWSNSKAPQNNQIPEKKTGPITTIRKPIKRTQSINNKKTPTTDSQQSLLNMYGFQKKTVLKRDFH